MPAGERQGAGATPPPDRDAGRARVVRGLIVLACGATVVLTVRILTTGSFTDLTPVVTEPPAVVAVGLMVCLGAAVVAVLAAAGSRSYRRAGLVWASVAVMSGVAWLRNGDDSGAAIVAIGALAVVLLLATRRSRNEQS